MTRENILLFLVIIILSVSVIGGYAGYDSTSLSTPETPESPGIISAIQWAGNSVNFMFEMMTFQIVDMPAIFSFFFLFCVLLSVYLLVVTVRG